MRLSLLRISSSLHSCTHRCSLRRMNSSLRAQAATGTHCQLWAHCQPGHYAGHHMPQLACTACYVQQTAARQHSMPCMAGGSLPACCSGTLQLAAASPRRPIEGRIRRYELKAASLEALLTQLEGANLLARNAPDACPDIGFWCLLSHFVLLDGVHEVDSCMPAPVTSAVSSLSSALNSLPAGTELPHLPV